MKKEKNKEAMLEVKVEDVFDTLFYTINREHNFDKDYDNQQLANMMRSSFTWEQQQPEHFDPVRRKRNTLVHTCKPNSKLNKPTPTPKSYLHYDLMYLTSSDSRYRLLTTRFSSFKDYLDKFLE